MSTQQQEQLPLPDPDQVIEGIRQRPAAVSKPTTEQHDDSELQYSPTATSAANASSAVSATSSDEEDPLGVVKQSKLKKLKKILPQSSDHLGKYVDQLLSPLPERFVIIRIVCKINSF